MIPRTCSICGDRYQACEADPDHICDECLGVQINIAAAALVADAKAFADDPTTPFSFSDFPYEHVRIGNSEYFHYSPIYHEAVRRLRSMPQHPQYHR